MVLVGVTRCTGVERGSIKSHQISFLVSRSDALVHAVLFSFWGSHGFFDVVQQVFNDMQGGLSFTETELLLGNSVVNFLCQASCENFHCIVFEHNFSICMNSGHFCYLCLCIGLLFVIPYSVLVSFQVVCICSSSLSRFLGVGKFII